MLMPAGLLARRICPTCSLFSLLEWTNRAQKHSLVYWHLSCQLQVTSPTQSGGPHHLCQVDRAYSGWLQYGADETKLKALNIGKADGLNDDCQKQWTGASVLKNECTGSTGQVFT